MTAWRATGWRVRLALLAMLGLAGVAPVAAQGDPKGIYDASCAGCHGPGVLGAPKFGDATQWGPRAKAGIDALVKSAVAGTPKGMPPKGGRADLNEAQLRSVIEYMMSGGKAAAAPAPLAKANPAPPRAAAPAAAAAPVRAATPTVPAAPAGAQQATAAAPRAASPAAAPAPGAQAAVTPSAPPPASAAAAEPRTPAPAQAAGTGVPQPAAPSPPAAVVAAVTAPAAAPAALAAVARAAPTPRPSAEVNAFNRLLKPPARINRPAVESGIHDPTNDMTLQLQPPSVAFAELPKSLAGNHVDWVKALDMKAIDPRWDKLDPAAAAVVMDLNIVREVKGSMPDVVYPHKQHTEWLDCSNCHPKIFVPQKGANQISMASILLGQQCGVCHGKVAFPVSECRLCHSRKKAAATVAGESRP
jgi:c(7)-type cytochrome triheme protein